MSRLEWFVLGLLIIAVLELCMSWKWLMTPMIWQDGQVVPALEAHYRGNDVRLN